MVRTGARGWGKKLASLLHPPLSQPLRGQLAVKVMLYLQFSSESTRPGISETKKKTLTLNQGSSWVYGWVLASPTKKND